MFAASNAAKQAYKAKLFTYGKDCQFILSYASCYNSYFCDNLHKISSTQLGKLIHGNTGNIL